MNSSSDTFVLPLIPLIVVPPLAGPPDPAAMVSQELAGEPRSPFESPWPVMSERAEPALVSR